MSDAREKAVESLVGWANRRGAPVTAAEVAQVLRTLGLVAVPADLAEAVRAGDAEGPLATPASLRARLALADAVLAQLKGDR